MGGCTAPNCNKRSEKDGVRLFRYPKNKERRLQWLTNAKRSNWEPKSSAALCELHFEDSQYEANREDNLRKLKPNAIPTIFDSPSKEQCGRSRKIVDYEDRVSSKLTRCCLCFEEVLEKEATALFTDGKMTPFGVSLKIILALGSAEMVSENLCTNCSNDVADCFETLMDLNVSALIANRRKQCDESGVENALKKGCEECGDALDSFQNWSQHFKDHLIKRYTPADLPPPPPVDINEENRPPEEEDDFWNESDHNDVDIFAPCEEKLLNDHCYNKERKLEHTSLICHVCGSLSKNRRAYTKHQWNHKRNPLYANKWERSKIKRTRERVVDNMEKTLFTCEICDVQFSHRGLMYNHYMIIHNIEVPEASLGRRRPWKCLICGDMFVSFPKLRTHGQKEHAGETVCDFQCELCSKKYNSFKCLRQHLKTVHLKPAVYQCEYCKNNYLKHSNLMSHIAAVHTIPDGLVFEVIPELAFNLPMANSLLTFELSNTLPVANPSVEGSVN